jgi:rubrerythrin
MTDPASPTDLDPIYFRAMLADMLAEAAELEHALCCQYLYAAFSLKKSMAEGLTARQADMARDWQTVLLDVARQEMEHMGLVFNIQVAIGEAPHLVRPSFPLTPQHYETGVVSKLEKFSIACIQRFVLFELPDDALSDTEKAELKKYVGWYDPAVHQTIGALYEKIGDLLRKITNEGKTEHRLFIGPPGAQFKIADSAQPQQVRRSGEHGVGTAYSVTMNGVTDLKSALATIEQIVSEGEGSTGNRADSHFGKFLKMLMQLTGEKDKYPSFEPARDVITDPLTQMPGRGNSNKPGNLITHETSRKVSLAFDQAYTTLMLLLARFFGATDQGEDDSMALENAAFFPMMTMVIRPLSEIITQLPAYADGRPGNAGPTFRFELRTALLPHRKSAFENIATNLEMLHHALVDLNKTKLGNPALDARLEFMAENVWRIANNFKTATGARSLL